MSKAEKVIRIILTAVLLAGAGYIWYDTHYPPVPKYTTVTITTTQPLLPTIEWGQWRFDDEQATANSLVSLSFKAQSTSHRGLMCRAHQGRPKLNEPWRTWVSVSGFSPEVDVTLEDALSSCKEYYFKL